MLACLHLTTTNQRHSVPSALWRRHGKGEKEDGKEKSESNQNKWSQRQ